MKSNLIERGNTQFGVNKFIVHYLMKNSQYKSLIDIPCGKGELLHALQKFCPTIEGSGVDLYEEPRPEIAKYFQKISVDQWIQSEKRQFDVVCSVSGVMVHDNLSAFFNKCAQVTHPGGLLIVTNDNFLTIRDRLNFLFFGHVKRFKKLYNKAEGNWNMVPIQALWKLFNQNHFEIETVKYLSIYNEDWLMLPFAILLFPIHLLYIALIKNDMSFRTRYLLFPFWVFLARHYVIVAKKRS